MRVAREGAASLTRILPCLWSAPPPGACCPRTLRVEMGLETRSAACRHNVPPVRQKGGTCMEGYVTYCSVLSSGALASWLGPGRCCAGKYAHVRAGQSTPPGLREEGRGQGPLVSRAKSHPDVGVRGRGLSGCAVRGSSWSIWGPPSSEPSHHSLLQPWRTNDSLTGGSSFMKYSSFPGLRSN